MSVTLAKPVAIKEGKSKTNSKVTGGADLGQGSSGEAKRRAAAILEVLAGARTPTEAATALGLSVPRYYQVESRALRGLLAACEAPPKGRVRSPESEVTAMRQENQRLQREVLRQQALVRAAQRTVGWTPPAAPAPAKSAGKKTRRRRVARALSIATRLQQTPDAASATTAPSTMESIS
jgi:hypothetical protein